MTTYTTRPNAIWRCVDDDGDVSLTCATVHECDTDPEPIGVLDANGDMLWRVFERRPIGFKITA